MKNIGGQAVIEGVMMKSPNGWAVAVRSPKGDITIKSIKTKKPMAIVRLPIIRGIFGLAHALTIGIKAIEFSGNIALQEKEEDKQMSKLSIGISIITAFIIAIGLFKFMPLFLTSLLSSQTNIISESPLFFNLIDGLFRVGIFFLYLISIGLWKEMKRIYEYHGAEHKVIHAYEAGEKLTLENIKKYKPYHPRCGTSFLLIVMVISILTFMFIPQSWSFIEKLLSRLLLIPLIAGISYEALRFSARMKNNSIIGLLVLPGLLLQRITVREPNENQIEVAIRALEEVLKLGDKGVCKEC